MNTNLFRENALDNIYSSEQLDKHIKILSFPVWGIYACIVIGFITLCFWGVFGNVTNKTTISGVIFPADDVQMISSNITGQIQDVIMSEGDYVNVGDVIAVVSDKEALAEIERMQNLMLGMQPGSYEYNAMAENLKNAQDSYVLDCVIKSSFSGYIQSIAAKGTVINVGDTLAIINVDNGDSGYNEVTAYVPIDVAKTLKLGMEAQISPNYAPREEYGYMEGVITSISSVPVTEESIIKHMGTMGYAESVMPDTTCIEMRIKISYDPESANSYKWSNKNGEKLLVEIGTQCNVQIITSSMKPIELLLGKG